jgi:hypothetical protein
MFDKHWCYIFQEDSDDFFARFALKHYPILVHSLGTKEFIQVKIVHLSVGISAMTICFPYAIQFQNLFLFSGDRPFLCKVCSKMFSDPSSLNRHMITHARKHPFICGQCETGFFRREHLTRHLTSRVHSGKNGTPN